MPRFIAFPIAAPPEGSFDFDVAVPLPSGVGLQRFQRNPLVLWSHVADDPIGTVRDLAVNDNVLNGRVRIETDRGASIVPKMREGLIRFGELAVDDEDEVLELSLVGAFSPGAELLEPPTPSDLASRIADGDDSRIFDRKENPTMSKDSPVDAARARLAAGRAKQGLGPLRHEKSAPLGRLPVASRNFDAGNEPEAIAQLQKLVDAAKRGELDRDGAKEGARLLEVLAALHAVTPDPPKDPEDPRHLDAKDPVAAARRRQEQKRSKQGMGPLAHTKDEGGDAA